MRKTNGEADARWPKPWPGQRPARRVAGRRASGLALRLVTDFHYPGHSADRCHTIEGRHGTLLLDHLVHRVGTRRPIDLLVPARLVDVRLDDDGRVAGGGRRDARRDDRGGADPGGPARHQRLRRRPDLVRRHLPEIADAVYHGSETSRGDALRIGAGLGADTAFLDAYQGHGALAAAHRRPWSAGRRSCTAGSSSAPTGDGSATRPPATPSTPRSSPPQPGAAGWIVLDQRIHDACLAFTDFRQTVDGGALVWADDVDGPAAATGLPAEALAEELRATEDARPRRVYPAGPVRAHVVRGAAPAAVRRGQGRAGAVPHPGRARRRRHARVLRPDGTPIEGLYASGGAAAGISGHGAAGYLAGNGLLPALGLAFLAAEDAARIPAGSDDPAAQTTH